MEWGRQTSEITSKVIIKLSSNSDWLTFSKQRLSDSLLIFLMFFGSFGIDFLPKYFRDFLSFLFRLRRKFSSCQLRTARHKNCFFLEFYAGVSVRGIRLPWIFIVCFDFNFKWIWLKGSCQGLIIGSWTLRCLSRKARDRNEIQFDIRNRKALGSIRANVFPLRFRRTRNGRREKERRKW